MEIRSVHLTCWPLLAAMILTLFLALPGGGVAQDATPTDCVPNEIDGSCLPVAPEGDRVDLAVPSFSNPTAIINPLFPISDLTQVIQLGIDAGETLRVEATLLPETKTIDWNGQQVETVVSQFIAYVDGRVVEVATDFYAQADDGSVWYFGEDVFNYEDGAIANTDGTWLAGVDGPPGMIMPGDPQVGDVYRPENIPGFVFEEVTVKAIDQTVDGPEGPVDGAIVIQELLMDGTLEEKTFAPGYGEFSAQTDTEFLVVSLGVPFDIRSETVPTAVSTLTTASAAIFEAVVAEDWEAISATVAKVTLAWDTYDAANPPPALGLQMDAAFDDLTTAVEDQDVAAVRQAAVDVGHACLDFQLQYRSLAEIELDRLALWTDQVLVDADANDPGGIAGDVVAMETIWERVAATVDQATAAQIETQLDDLRAASDAGDLAAANELVLGFRDLLAAAP